MADRDRLARAHKNAAFHVEHEGAEREALRCDRSTCIAFGRIRNF
jgi:hypothetical protein